jgi:hypothetical protein
VAEAGGKNHHTNVDTLIEQNAGESHVADVVEVFAERCPS